MNEKTFPAMNPAASTDRRIQPDSWSEKRPTGSKVAGESVMMIDQFLTRALPFATRPLSNMNDAPVSPDDPAEISGGSSPVANVVLYQPEIPQNTGNIGRSCVAVGAKLWIVRPASFDFSDKRVRRAGLDYWQYLNLQAVDQWSEIPAQLPDERTFFFSRFAKRTAWEVEFQAGDTFVFGRETAGLPREIVGPDHPRALRLPTTKYVRSLNLASTVAIVLFEQQRQLAQAKRGI